MNNCLSCNKKTFGVKFKIYTHQAISLVVVSLFYQEKKGYSLNLKLSGDNPVVFSIDDINTSRCFLEIVLSDFKGKPVEKIYSVVFPGDNLITCYQISGKWIVNSQFGDEFIKEIIIEPIKKLDLERTHNVKIVSNKTTYEHPLVYIAAKDNLLVSPIIDELQTFKDKLVLGFPVDFVVAEDKIYKTADKFGDKFFFEITNKDIKTLLTRFTTSDITERDLTKVKNDLKEINNNLIFSYNSSQVGDYLQIEGFQGLEIKSTCKERVFAFCLNYGNIWLTKIYINNFQIKPIILTKGV